MTEAPTPDVVDRLRDKWLRSESIKLHAGEMTAGELRTVKAVVAAVLSEVEPEITRLRAEVEGLRKERDAAIKLYGHGDLDADAENWALLYRAEAAEASLAQCRETLAKSNRTATDRLYMMETYRSMLGPKGLEVAAMWERKGVKRVHHSWGPGGLGATGEERAQFILDLESAPKTLVTNIDAELPPDSNTTEPDNGA